MCQTTMGLNSRDTGQRQPQRKGKDETEFKACTVNFINILKKHDSSDQARYKSLTYLRVKFVKIIPDTIRCKQYSLAKVQ
jgi:hypothetical protein